MISTLHWVPKGAAKAEPEQYELSSEDVQALQEKFSEQLRAAMLYTPRTLPPVPCLSARDSPSAPNPYLS